MDAGDAGSLQSMAGRNRATVCASTGRHAGLLPPAAAPAMELAANPTTAWIYVPPNATKLTHVFPLEYEPAYGVSELAAGRVRTPRFGTAVCTRRDDGRSSARCADRRDASFTTTCAVSPS